MDVSPGAAAPWIVLGVVLLVLAVLAGMRVGARRARGAGRAAAEPPAEAGVSGSAPAFAEDDLPGFLAFPPGTPGAEAEAGPAPSPRPSAPPADEEPAAAGTGRVVAAMVAAALVLIALLALVAIVLRPSADESATPSATSSRTPGATAQAGGSAAAPPEPLPGVPVDPLPGETGAGALAMRSVPVGEDGTTARLAFGGLVLERRAVGVTVTYPGLSVTVAGDGTALAHLRLPTWNCLGTAAPADPVAAGCVPGPTEWADLPSPQLTAERADGGLRLTGRFPTYTDPAGTEPVYTGRVYALTLTVTPAGRARDGWAPAAGTVFLGTERAEALADPALSAVRGAG
ncbi:hypothetical protein [Blastococcus sp. SYSU D00820]